MKLGERLQAIAIFAVGGGPMADIGTDHAYLPICLLQQNDIPRAIAVEVCEGPYQAALAMIGRYQLSDKIDLRFGNGLEPLSPGEAATIVIAGMGGATITEILSGRPQVTGGAQRLILQPMTAAGTLRRWLISQQWRIVDEALVLDEGRLYEIIVAEQGPTVNLEDILYEIGPILWNKKPALLLMHLEQIIGSTGRVLQEMEQSPRAVQSPKYEELKKRMTALEEKRECLLNAI